MKTKASAILLTALFLTLAVGAAADTPRDGARRHREEERMRTYLVVRIADALGLSDEKALAVGRIFREADERRAEARGKRREIEDKIREALDKAKPDSASLAKLVEQATALDKQQEQRRDETVQALKKVLSVEEQAKLVLLRPALWRETRLMHGPGGEHGRWRGHEEGRERREHGPDRKRRAPDDDGGTEG